MDLSCMLGGEGIHTKREAATEGKFRTGGGGDEVLLAHVLEALSIHFVAPIFHAHQDIMQHIVIILTPGYQPIGLYELYRLLDD